MNIIFDLDGTLIDSSFGILTALESAFIECGVEMRLPLNDELIGPPLNILLGMLAGMQDEALLTRLKIAFKACYDTVGYKQTKTFEGIDDLLLNLKNKGHRLYIGTNKRMIPTQKIIDYLGWRELFIGIYALDTCVEAKNKSALIAYILKEHQILPNQSIYVGDTVPDRIASQDNKLPFVMVSWGYEFLVEPGDHYVETVAELTQFLD